MSTTASSLPSSAVETLAQRLRGELIEPDDRRYDDARRRNNR